jgi:epoxyqueuosine reductase
MPNLISEAASAALAALRVAAWEEGLPLVRVTQARLPSSAGEHLRQFIDAGHAGDMAWMAETMERRRSPDAMWPDAASAIILAQPYTPEVDPLSRIEERSTGVISVYALNRDYHDVFKGKLKRLAQDFARASGAEVKVFVDTAPLMEKPLAAQGRSGLAGTAQQSCVARGRQLVLHRNNPDLGHLAARRPRDRSLRDMPGLPRHLPDCCLSRPLPT